jgi:hypothetical protein
LTKVTLFKLVPLIFEIILNGNIIIVSLSIEIIIGNKENNIIKDLLNNDIF